MSKKCLIVEWSLKEASRVSLGGIQYVKQERLIQPKGRMQMKPVCGI